MTAVADVKPAARYLPGPIRDLVRTLESGLRFDASQAAEMLSKLEIGDSDLRPWHDFNHPVTESYGRLLVAAGHNFELMVMSWAPGDYSAIHDHGAAEWGGVRYFGPADHVIFDEDRGLLSLKERMTMGVGDVYAVDESLIHLMGNPTDSPFVSLHLYGRSEAAESIPGGARIFDLYEQRIQRTDGGVFFCLPEELITGREPCPRPDDATRSLHHRLMLARLRRMSGAVDLPPEMLARIGALQAIVSPLPLQSSNRGQA